MRGYKVFGKYKRRRGLTVRPDLLKVDWYSEHRLTIEVASDGESPRRRGSPVRRAVLIGFVTSVLGTAAWWTLTHVDIVWRWLVEIFA